MTLRLSRGTPRVLTSAEIDTALAAITPSMENTLITLLDLTPEEWRKLDSRMKVKHLQDHQTRGMLAASLAASTKAQTDLQEAATAITDAVVVNTLREEVQALTQMVHELRGGSPAPAGRRSKR